MAWNNWSSGGLLIEKQKGVHLKINGLFSSINLFHKLFHHHKVKLMVFIFSFWVSFFINIFQKLSCTARVKVVYNSKSFQKILKGFFDVLKCSENTGLVTGMSFSLIFYYLVALFVVSAWAEKVILKVKRKKQNMWPSFSYSWDHCFVGLKVLTKIQRSLLSSIPKLRRRKCCTADFCGFENLLRIDSV